MTRALVIVGGVWVGLAISTGTNMDRVFSVLFGGGVLIAVAGLLVHIATRTGSDND